MSDIPDAPALDPETAARIERENTSVGQYERLAGIGQSPEERLAFWQQFQHPDGQECIRLAMNECRRRSGLPQRPPPKTDEETTTQCRSVRLYGARALARR